MITCMLVVGGIVFIRNERIDWFVAAYLLEMRKHAQFTFKCSAVFLSSLLQWMPCRVVVGIVTGQRVETQPFHLSVFKPIIASPVFHIQAQKKSATIRPS